MQLENQPPAGTTAGQDLADTQTEELSLTMLLPMPSCLFFYIILSAEAERSNSAHKVKKQEKKVPLCSYNQSYG